MKRPRIVNPLPGDEQPKKPVGKRRFATIRMRQTVVDDALSLTECLQADHLQPSSNAMVEAILVAFVEMVRQKPGERQTPRLVKLIDQAREMNQLPSQLPESRIRWGN
jgi:hypothetical protein